MQDYPTNDELYNIKPVAFDEESLRRRTFEKLGLDQLDQMPSRPHVGKLRTALLVAALAVALPSAAYATVLGIGAFMSAQDITYFSPPQPTLGEGNASLYFQGSQASLEQFNAPVGQTQAFDGGTITLDAVAVDDSFVNAFFTLAFDQPIDTTGLHTGSNAPVPTWWGLFILAPRFHLLANGQPFTANTTPVSTVDSQDCDPYLVDEHTLAVMVHQVIVTPQPNQFELTIDVDDLKVFAGGTEPLYPSLQSGLVFKVLVNKGAPAALTRAIEPGIYTFTGGQEQRTLDLQRIAFTPFGATVTVAEQMAGDVPAQPQGLEAYLVADDRGNTAQVLWVGGLDGRSELIGAEMDGKESKLSVARYSSYTYELLGLDPTTQSVTLTPIVSNDGAAGQNGLRTANLTQVGAQVAVTPLGGYTVETYLVEDSRITVTLKPYGHLLAYQGKTLFMPDDLTSVKLAENNQDVLTHSYFDRATGTLTTTWDYYATTEEELRTITAFAYLYDATFSLDHEAALTLPLN
ncbi:MAG: DUF4179 domain-containing protein [Coriobacteriales bacterium]|jgi:hypothetical protein|nr:DUF4179 domain-containing protein [Coriobacteriales bacterium]